MHLHSVLIQKEYMHFLWNMYKVSQYFERRNMYRLLPFSCEMRLGF